MLKINVFVTRLPLLVSTVCGVLALVVYLATGAPGLMYTDAGELAAACSTLGVAHPTGYPLFTLLGFCWLKLPWPSAIIGMNVFAAVCTAASVALCCAIVYRLTKNIFLAAACSCAYAVTTYVWPQGTSVEVYSLQALLVAACLYTAMCAGLAPRQQQTRWFLYCAGSVGLMLCNHLSGLFLLPGLVVVARGAMPWRYYPKALAMPALVAFSCAALYGVLPVRSMQEPLINWGYVHRSADAFLYHVMGKQFTVWFFSDAAATKQNLRDWASVSWSSWYVLLTLVPVALRASGLRAVVAGVLLMLVGNVVVSAGYAIPDIANYFVPSVLFLAVLIGVGGSTLTINSRMPWLIAGIVSTVAIINAVNNWKSQDLSRHDAVNEYTQWALATADSNAIILTRQWDFLCSAVWYKQAVENQRTDVVLIEKELLRRTWYLPYLHRLYPSVMRRNIDEQRRYVALLEQFETNTDSFMKSPNNAQEIQRRFVALLRSFIEHNRNRSVYITPEVYNEEDGAFKDVVVVPDGPFLKVIFDTTTPPTLVPRWEHIDGVVQSLEGTSQRLDTALAATVLQAIAANQQFAGALGNTSAMQKFSRMAQRLRTNPIVPAYLR
jgi:hypothetical protein